MVVVESDAKPGGKQESVKRGRGGGASNLFNAFDSNRKYDPFLDTDPVIQNSKAGMEALLSMCNGVEINSVCGALGIVEPCSRSAKTQQVKIYAAQQALAFRSD